MSQADWKLRAATSTLAVVTTIADNGHRARTTTSTAFNQQSPFPAEFFGDGIAFQRQIGRGDPRAEKIHPAPEQQQARASKNTRGCQMRTVIVHYFFP